MPLVRKPGGAPPTPAVAQTQNGLSDPNDDVRWAAAREVPATAEAGSLLAAALRIEPSPRVREAMLTSLARIGNASSVAAVLPLLRSDDAQLRTGALDALRIMIRGASQLLPPLLEDADVDVRILSCDLARMLPGDEATAMLCVLLQREQDVNVCAAALDVLAESGQSTALPTLAMCALKFRDTPFLAFAIQVTADRISAKPSLPRG
jgi:hypothetical protein